MGVGLKEQGFIDWSSFTWDIILLDKDLMQLGKLTAWGFSEIWRKRWTTVGEDEMPMLRWEVAGVFIHAELGRLEQGYLVKSKYHT